MVRARQREFISGRTGKENMIKIRNKAGVIMAATVSAVVLASIMETRQAIFVQPPKP